MNSGEKEITDARSEMSALEEKVSFYAHLLDNIYTGIVVFDYAGIILFSNAYVLKIIEGTSPENILGANIREFVVNDFHQHIETDFQMVRTLKSGYSNYYIIRDLKGREKWIEIHGSEIVYAGQPAVLVAMRDVTMRKKFEEALQESQELFKTIVDTSHDGMVMINKSFQIVYVNNELCKILGRDNPEIVGHDFREFISEKDVHKVSKFYRLRQQGESAPPRYEISVVRKDGLERRIELSVSAITNQQGNVLTVAQLLDVTEKRMMEEELLNMRKLESVGLLAGGIAHDFNNILNAILGNLSLAKISHRNTDDEYTLIDEAEKAVLRAKGLTYQLLTFSKGGAPVKKKTNVNRIVRDAVNFSLAGSNIKCRFDLDPGLFNAEVDEGQIHQVIHNLVINAKHAMPEGGFIDISTKNTASAGTEPRGSLPDSSVMIQIKDYGHGIREEHLPKIFDPYFTTREKGQGLGLASVYSIVNRHGGRITVDSRVDSGSVFTVYLPAVMDKKPDSAINDPAADLLAPLNCRVLFMDDEEMVRNIAEKMLRRIGCDVYAVHEGTEAIKKYTEFRDSGRPFDVVIMDLTIPGGMGGKEAVKKLREIDPSLKAIVSSGYSNDPVMSRHSDYGFVDVITKPFKLDDLSIVLKRVICR